MTNLGLTIELWFDNQAEEAARFYTGVFKDSELGAIRYYTTDTPSNKPLETPAARGGHFHQLAWKRFR